MLCFSLLFIFIVKQTLRTHTLKYISVRSILSVVCSGTLCIKVAIDLKKASRYVLHHSSVQAGWSGGSTLLGTGGGCRCPCFACFCPCDACTDCSLSASSASFGGLLDIVLCEKKHLFYEVLFTDSYNLTFDNWSQTLSVPLLRYSYFTWGFCIQTNWSLILFLYCLPHSSRT